MKPLLKMESERDTNGKLMLTTCNVQKEHVLHQVWLPTTLKCTVLRLWIAYKQHEQFIKTNPVINRMLVQMSKHKLAFQ